MRDVASEVENSAPDTVPFAHQASVFISAMFDCIDGQQENE